MRLGDLQLFVPNIVYKATTTQIEALDLEEGAVAFATDTNQFGSYSGSTWTWYAVSATGGALSAFAAYPSANRTPSNQTWTKMNINTVNVNYGSHYDGTTNYRWSPPAGLVIVTFIANVCGTNTNGIYAGVARSGSILSQHCHRRGSSYCTSVQACFVEENPGSYYYEAYGYRYNGGYYLSGTGTRFTGICLKV